MRYNLLFLLLGIFISNLIKGQSCELDTNYFTVLKDSINVAFSCDYMLNNSQVGLILKEKGIKSKLKKKYYYKTIEIESSQFTIALFKLKKRQKGFEYSFTGYLTTANPLFSKLFTSNGHLILIYSYIPYESSNSIKLKSTIELISIYINKYLTKDE